MEPLETGLALRAVNSSRSAYSCFLFSPSFFLRYDDRIDTPSQASQDAEETTRWRVTMKSCLAVFKSLSNLEKNVDRCNINLDAEDCRLVFQLHCRHGIVKTYNLVYQETETLQAVFSKDLCPNRITAPAKLLAEAVGSFQSSQEEVTMFVTPTQLGYKNYVDDEPDPTKVVHSELRLVPEEFTEYLIGVDTEVTFSLKDLRAILSFSDAAGLPLSVHFETPGKPIVFSVESEQTLEATFVLATLTEVSSSQVTGASQQARASQAAPVNPQQRHKKKNNPRKSSTAGPGSRKNQSNNNGDDRRMPNGHTTRDEYEDDFPDDLMADLLNRNERTVNQTNENVATGPPVSSRLDPTPSTSKDNDDTAFTSSPVIPFDSALSHRFQKTVNDQSHHDDRLHPPESAEEEGHKSPNRTLLANFMDDDSRESLGDGGGPSLIRDEGGGGDRNSDVDLDDDDDDEFNFIPATPPSKKFKSMFFGASQSQQSQSSTQRSRPPPSQPHQGGAVTVLAEDSDED
ncbi:cell cycle checkpoint control protein RAD9A-like [Lytechinus pictus]|uniref:cell cycle checkpoint control protein RAD9A-like n=1 Tax=Lytechinus pictus TaxID=7653 RepID=UPI0030B9C8B4